MKQIKLKCRKFVLIDDEDYQRVSQYKWCLSGNGHIMRYEGNKGVYLHHFLIGQPIPPKLTDHINRNPLDNRKTNLRIGDKRLNSLNRGPGTNNTSGYKGVSWDKSRKKWTAVAAFYGRTIHLGRFKRKGDAVYARERYRRNYETI